MSAREILTLEETADRVERLYQDSPPGKPVVLPEHLVLNVLGLLRSYDVDDVTPDEGMLEALCAGRRSLACNEHTCPTCGARERHWK